MPCFSSVVVWLDDQMTMDEYTRDILLGLNSLRTCGNFCDINMVATDGTKFPVHRCILAAASNNLYQYAIDVQSDVCVDIDANILEIFLDILYTGKVSPLCDKNDIDKLKEISNILRMDCVLNLLNEKDETEQSINDEMACCSQKTSSCQNMNAIPMHKKKRGRPRKRNDVTLEENDKKRLKLDDTILDSTEKPSKRYLPKRATRGKTGLERLKIINSMRNDSSQQLKRHSVYDESMYVEFSDEVQSVNPGDCIDKCLDTTCSDLYDKDTAIYVENNDEDPEIFAKKVSTSLSQILSQLQTSVSSCTTLSENEKHSDTEKREEWKNCPYCSKFKGIKKGRYQFHIRFCHLPLKCVHCFKPFESKRRAVHY
ncbi:uncharacterized protein LOC141900597 isoform X2 [Tubulanus polymorphus]|uniref:uncharacterized protein LOC141900597 isoform X2 n=1 Tax=Tubulanus polymorphus TaxID=672921 RepID=UPI003DA33324